MIDKLILGTAQFGLDYGINNKHGKISEKEVFNILDTAISNKILFLDTAEAYGDAQKIIGKYHRESESGFNIITKFDASRSDLPKKIWERVKKNLNILGINYLYCYMFHSFNDFLKFYKTNEKDLIKLKKDGYIRKFGVSVYTNSEIQKLLDYDFIDLIQLPFNLFDNSSIRYFTIKQAKERSIEVHTRSTFLQGLFFMDQKKLPYDLKPLAPYLQDLKGIAEFNHMKISELALTYVIDKPYIDRVLVGTDTNDQLLKNIESINTRIPQEVVRQIDKIYVDNQELLNPSNWK